MLGILYSSCRNEFCSYLNRPDHKQEFVFQWQQSYNSIAGHLRKEEAMKVELHHRVDVSSLQSPSSLYHLHTLPLHLFHSFPPPLSPLPPPPLPLPSTSIPPPPPLLHTQDLCDKLWDICDRRRDEATQERQRIVTDQWLEDHTSLLTNYYISIMQVNWRERRERCERDGEEGRNIREEGEGT